MAKPVVKFMQDVADFRKCVIFDTAGMRREVSPQECVGLERAAAWEPDQVERRLLDTFLGWPNQDELQLRVRLS
ncbi:MAG: hypothetical protein ACM30G_05065 [Micromonosporaceae bacterium]